MYSGGGSERDALPVRAGGNPALFFDNLAEIGRELWGKVRAEGEGVFSFRCSVFIARKLVVVPEPRKKYQPAYAGRSPGRIP